MFEQHNTKETGQDLLGKNYPFISDFPVVIAVDFY